jgi:nucleotide-binding universal stress UspA family protein
MRAPDEIVLATDLSPASAAAVNVVRELARLFKAKVVLLHIFQYTPKHRYKIPVEWMVEIIRNDTQNKLEEVKKLFQQAELEAEVVILENGHAANQIIDFVQSCRNPLLAMGTHAAGGMARFMLGSTAEEVLRHVHCPVITVGPHVVFPAENSSPFRNILYATDFSDASLAAIPFIDALRQLTGAHLRVLHVLPDIDSEATAEQFEVVRKLFQTSGCEEYVTLHGTHVSQVVVHEAEQYSAALLFLGVKRSSAFAAHTLPKITFQIIAASPCAVLTVSS